jgi:hypothetical protein
MHKHNQNATEPANSLRSKVKNFLELTGEPDPEAYVDVMAFWNLQSRAQPILADLAMKLLSIPAGSDGADKLYC